MNEGQGFLQFSKKKKKLCSVYWEDDSTVTAEHAFREILSCSQNLPAWDSQTLLGAAKFWVCF